MSFYSSLGNVGNNYLQNLVQQANMRTFYVLSGFFGTTETLFALSCLAVNYFYLRNLEK